VTLVLDFKLLGS